MAIPKSAKLQREEAANKREPTTSAMLPPQAAPETGPLKIRPIKCCNEFVALLRSTIQSSVELAGEAKMLDEGIVVGVGPGVATNNGRSPSQVALGDRVMFFGAPVTAINSEGGFYQGKTVIIISERNLLCHLSQQRPFEIVEG